MGRGGERGPEDCLHGATKNLEHALLTTNMHCKSGNKVFTRISVWDRLSASPVVPLGCNLCIRLIGSEGDPRCSSRPFPALTFCDLDAANLRVQKVLCTELLNQLLLVLVFLWAVWQESQREEKSGTKLLAAGSKAHRSARFKGTGLGTCEIASKHLGGGEHLAGTAGGTPVWSGSCLPSMR